MEIVSEMAWRMLSLGYRAKRAIFFFKGIIRNNIVSVKEF